jgi:hypothetical protein
MSAVTLRSCNSTLKDDHVGRVHRWMTRGEITQEPHNDADQNHRESDSNWERCAVSEIARKNFEKDRACEKRGLLSNQEWRDEFQYVNRDCIFRWNSVSRIRNDDLKRGPISASRYLFFGGKVPLIISVSRGSSRHFPWRWSPQSSDTLSPDSTASNSDSTQRIWDDLICKANIPQSISIFRYVVQIYQIDIVWLMTQYFRGDHVLINRDLIPVPILFKWLDSLAKTLKQPTNLRKDILYIVVGLLSWDMTIRLSRSLLRGERRFNRREIYDYRNNLWTYVDKSSAMS